MPATEDDIEELYRSRYASYRAGATILTGSPEMARDVVQAAFAQALQTRQQYRGDGPLAAWVWRIAFRIALQARQASDRELTFAEVVEHTPLPSAERDPALAEALQQLPPRRRMVVFLRYFADLSYAEIAWLCEITEGAVAATLSQAHDALRQALPKEGVRL